MRLGWFRATKDVKHFKGKHAAFWLCVIFYLLLQNLATYLTGELTSFSNEEGAQLF